MAKETNPNRVCPAERAGMLDNLVRRLIHNPHRILKGYVGAGMTVLDIGCGPGLFSLAMAEMVGPSGKVIAADLQEAMLNKLKIKIRGSELQKRIILHQTASDRIGITTSLDFVLAFYVVHELPDRDGFFREIAAYLKPGGKILLAEPKFHVSEQEFSATLESAAAADIKILSRIRILFSRAAVLST